MEVFTERFTYRHYKETDKEEILRLWQEESGWGAITHEQFERWFINTPFGKCIIIVAVDTNDGVAGQIIFSPTKMIVNGEEIKSLRASAPIIRSVYREENLRSFDHPAFALIKKGIEIALEEGYQLVYSFPSYGWLGLLRMFPRVMPNYCGLTSYDCFAISLEEPQTFIESQKDYRVSISATFTQEYDYLWLEAIQQMPVKCGIARAPKLLKYLLGGHLVLETRSSITNLLVGYMAVNKKTGLIIDVFARSIADLEQVLRCSVNALHLQNDKKIPVSFTQLKGMLTPTLKPVTDTLGYSRDSYRFAFTTYLLDPAIPAENIKESQWYMTPMG